MADHDRLRTHPKDRLAAPVQRIDLAEAVARLRAESHPSVSGHRQIALARHGSLSLILFAFEKDGFLKEHQAAGEVIIQVLAGQLSVSVAADEFTLGPGAMLTLAPGLLHSVRALKDSDMLLTLSRVESEQ
jgi:quercetin dioxygenase-like cupin family protein